MATNNPAAILDKAEMTSLQIVVVVIAIGLNALDGFDLLSISFAAPGIAREWGVDRLALGAVLSMELIGMGVGSFFLGGLADKVGRKPTILFCLAVMALGMLLSPLAQNITQLSMFRILTGLGIGGMLAAINAMTAEFSNIKFRSFCISVMAIGYPLGGVIGGTCASYLLSIYDWRAVFYLGTGLTLAFIPCVYFLMPESVHWLSAKQPAKALERVNHTMARMGHNLLTSLPNIQSQQQRGSPLSALSATMLRSTILVGLVYLFHIVSFYFLLKWLPKIVVDMGFEIASAGSTLVWTNVGGMLGGLSFGFLTLRFDLKWITVFVLIASFLMLAVFGQTPDNLATVSVLAATVGFFSNAGVVAMYAIMARMFPTELRAFGTGAVVGVGRIGSVVSPILAGFLFSLNLELSVVAVCMAFGSLIAAMVLLLLTLEKSVEL